MCILVGAGLTVSAAPAYTVAEIHFNIGSSTSFRSIKSEVRQGSDTPSACSRENSESEICASQAEKVVCLPIFVAQTEMASL